MTPFSLPTLERKNIDMKKQTFCGLDHDPPPINKNILFIFPLSLITDIYIYILLKIRGSGNPK